MSIYCVVTAAVCGTHYTCPGLPAHISALLVRYPPHNWRFAKEPNPFLYGWNVNFNEKEVKIVQPRPNIPAAKKGDFITSIVILWFSSSITFSFIFKENSPESITFYSTWYILRHIVGPLRMNTVSRKAFKHFVGRVIKAELFSCFSLAFTQLKIIWNNIYGTKTRAGRRGWNNLKL